MSEIFLETVAETLGELHKERDALRAENEGLREALKSISWYRQWYVHKPIADKTQIEHDLDVIIKTAEQALEVTK